MAESKNNEFNTEELVSEINNVINKGLRTILKDYINRYDLLETTHQQIMNLPSVLNELKRSPTEKIIETEQEQQELETESVVYKNVSNNIEQLNDRMEKLEKKLSSCIFAIDCMIKNFQDLNRTVINQTKQEESKEIKSTIVAACENENIKVEFKETEVVENKEEEEQEEEEEEEEEQEEVEEEEEEEEEEQEEQEEQEEKEQEVEVEEEEQETEEEEETNEQVEEEEEETNEEDEIETEASVKEEQEQEQEEEDDEELFEIDIDGVTYCTNDEENGFIYDLLKDGDVGEKIGYLKEGEPFFYADEK